MDTAAIIAVAVFTAAMSASLTYLVFRWMSKKREVFERLPEPWRLVDKTVTEVRKRLMDLLDEEGFRGDEFIQQKLLLLAGEASRPYLRRVLRSIRKGMKPAKTKPETLLNELRRAQTELDKFVEIYREVQGSSDRDSGRYDDALKHLHAAWEAIANVRYAFASDLEEIKLERVRTAAVDFTARTVLPQRRPLRPSFWRRLRWRLSRK